MIEIDLLPWIITILIIFVFVQFVYIMFLIDKVANLREALFRDNDKIEGQEAMQRLRDSYFEDDFA